MNRSPSAQTKTEMLAEKIARLRSEMKLETWNSFIEELQVPSDLMPAMMTMRHELMPKGRALTADECEVVYRLISVLLQTNAALREHAEQTAGLVSDWHSAFKSLATLAGYIEMYARMRAVEEEEADG